MLQISGIPAGRMQKGAMLDKELDFARLTVHMQLVEEKKKKISEAREVERQAKRARLADQSHSQSQGIYYQAPVPRPPADRRSQSFQTNHGTRAQDTRSQGSVAQQHLTFPRCETYGRNHFGRCQLGSIVCYSCGQSGHFQRKYPSARKNVGGAKSQANSSEPPPPQKGTTSAAGNIRNWSYALTNRQEAEASPDVITGDSIVARRVYRGFVVTVGSQDKLADLIELDM
ncbi:uncharacterized protein LOC107876974, partial [Capsicum annuum]|uniref:uncharacterized protein LOC107876974 n=1 Tax=Capsicum annuum TaxID=4072 RepID=UPI001FB0D806